MARPIRTHRGHDFGRKCGHEFVLDAFRHWFRRGIQVRRAETALDEIVFGGTNPSGRLPVTFERRWKQPSARQLLSQAGTKRVVYKEEYLVGYRGYERAGTKPLFPFGFGCRTRPSSIATCRLDPLRLQDRWRSSGGLTRFLQVKIQEQRGRRLAASVNRRGADKSAAAGKGAEGFVK